MSAPILRAAILCAALTPPALAQDDPLETRLYNVEFLTTLVQDHPGEELGLARTTLGVTISAESKMDAGMISPDDLIRLIKTNVAEDTWEHVAANVAYSKGVLTVTNRRSAHEKIQQYLNYWRGFLGKMISVDAAIVSIDPQLLARIRSAGNPDRPAVLPPEHAKAVLDAAREGKLAELIASKRVTAHPGQRVNLQDLAKQQYIRDFDVQIATAAAAIDPVIDVLATGASFDVRPFLEPFANAVTIEVRADLVSPEALEDRKLKLTKDLSPAAPLEADGKPGAQPKGFSPAQLTEARIQLPRVAHDRIRTTLTMRGKETAIVGSVLRKGRNLVFLVTPAVIAVDEKPVPEPAFEEQRLMRLYDISPLTRGIQDWPGPSLNLVGAHAGGTLTGATFTLDEPAVMMQSADVASMIRGRIAPDTWGNRRNAIDDTQRGTLIIRQKPDVLREIDRFLNTLLTARSQMITTEALVIGFRKGARAEWEQQIPALLPGGYFAEQEKVEKLLEAAYKGERVRLVETAEVTGFPQERVHAFRIQEEAYLADYEPQVSSFAGMYDPIVSELATGFLLDVRPHYVHGNDQIAVDFRGRLTAGQVKDGEVGTAGVGALQFAQAKVLKWTSNVTCVKGKYSLVALETVGRGDDAEDLAVFVRARQNVLK